VAGWLYAIVPMVLAVGGRPSEVRCVPWHAASSIGEAILLGGFAATGAVDDRTVAAFLVRDAGMDPIANSTCRKGVIGKVLVLGGFNSAGIVDANATKQILVTDPAGNLSGNCTVVIDFSACTAQDIRLSQDQPHHPGTLFNCAAKTVTAVSNASGIATFRLAGGAAHSGANSPGVSSPCAVVRVEGILLGSLVVAAPDEDSSEGVNALDLAAFASDRFGSYRARSDFDGDGSLTALDLSIFARFRFSGQSTNTHAVCP
jgi:hypothetical protein